MASEQMENHDRNEQKQVITFEDAVQRTIPQGSCGCFQILAFIVFITSVVALQPVWQGLAFLEKIPPRFECQLPQDKMQKAEWQECNHDYICQHPGVEYRADSSQAEYFDNWVSKLDLLCADSNHVGFLGSCLFIGLLSSIFWLPSFADSYGRRWPLIGSILFQLIGYLILYHARSLHVAYVGMFIMGATFPGKHVVFYNYVLEACPQSYKQTIVSSAFFLETVFVLLTITGYYQFFSKSYVILIDVSIIATVICLMISINFFHESPSFLYGKLRFDEARENLATMAAFNGIYSQDFKDTVFSKEAELQRSIQALNQSFAGDEAARLEIFAMQSENQDGHGVMTDRSNEEEQPLSPSTGLGSSQKLALKASFVVDDNYHWNIAIMTVMWCAASFGCYELNFLNKYLEGSIYANNYVEAAAAFIACMIGAQVYSYMGQRFCFATSFLMCLVGGITVFILEIDAFKLPLISGAKTQEEVVSILVPKVIFFAKLGIQMAHLASYQASYSDETMFPAALRATAIGQCQMVARVATIAAPQITELKKPAPILVFNVICLIAFLVSLTMKGKPSVPLKKQL